MGVWPTVPERRIEANWLEDGEEEPPEVGTRHRDGGCCGLTRAVRDDWRIPDHAM